MISLFNLLKIRFAWAKFEESFPVLGERSCMSDRHSEQNSFSAISKIFFWNVATNSENNSNPLYLKKSHPRGGHDKQPLHAEPVDEGRRSAGREDEDDGDHDWADRGW